MTSNKNKNNSKELNKIEQVFQYAKENKITFVENKPNKKNNSSGTWKTYSDTMKSYEKWLQKQGIKDITRAKPRHSQEYMQMMMEKNKKGERGGSAFTMGKFPHALHALQTLAKESGVYKGLRLGNRDKLLDMKNQAGIERKSSESTSMKASTNEFNKVQQEILSSNSPQKQLISEIHQIQRGVGCRIHEAVKMKPEDITFNNNGTATVEIIGKGGLKRLVKVTDSHTVQLLKHRTEGVKPGTELFHTKNRQGKDKSRNSTIKQVQDVVSGAAKRAGFGGGGGEPSYNTHSARKTFAQETLDRYSKMTFAELNRELARRITEDTSGKLKEKKDSELWAIKNKIHLTIKGRRTREEGQALRDARTFNHKELATFLVSVDTGHFRLSIMRYYCDYKPKDDKDKQ